LADSTLVVTLPAPPETSRATSERSLRCCQDGCAVPRAKRRRGIFYVEMQPTIVIYGIKD
jgi:hypothetical protein